ncbi:MAG: M20/M25/M40 family metallo-hydrolase [Oscillospiraceae bacterium]|nr:M20/M25/M40 family metallo-hydrolase [Oscillospiraceae bacterium]
MQLGRMIFARVTLGGVYLQPILWIIVIAAALLLGAGAFYGITLSRAAKTKSSNSVFTPIPSTDAERIGHAANALSAIIKCRTVSRDNPLDNDASEWVKLRDRLRRDFPLTHKTLAREIISDYSLLYIWKSDDSEGEPLLLSAHIDVADADGEWEYPPFDGVISDGYVWGRGTLDCKCSIIAMLEAVETLLERGFKPKRDIYLAFSHDQESGTAGALALARFFADRNLSFYMILDEGGWVTRGLLPIRVPVAQVGIAEKGRMRVKLSVDTNGGHASLPPRHTSVGLLSEAIARVEYRPYKARLTSVVVSQLKNVIYVLPFRWRYALANLPLTNKTLIKLCSNEERLNPLVRSTVAAVRFDGGSSGNVLPGEASAFLDIRLLHGDSGEGILQFIRDMVSGLGVFAEDIGTVPPSDISERKCEQFNVVKECILDVFGSIEISPSLTITSTCSRQYEQFCPFVYRFSPFTLTPVDQSRLHGRGEGVRVDSLGLAISFYRELIEKVCE